MLDDHPTDGHACALCLGDGFIVECDHRTTRYRGLFVEGRTAICPRCGGTGADPGMSNSMLVTTIISVGAMIVGMLVGVGMYLGARFGFG